MARNIEIKARVAALEHIRAIALSFASEPGGTLRQTDTFFVVSEGRLKVREFTDGTGELIAYDRPNIPGPKPSSYSRHACQNASSLCETLSRVLPVRGVVRKEREVVLIGQTRVHLDTVEHLGTFVELEVVLSDGQSAEHGDRIARELLRTLGISDSNLISVAYIDLLDEAASHRPQSAR
jgi:predicted adenylyl cyclase CyaB